MLPTRETLLHRVSRKYDDEAWKEFLHYYGGYVQNIACRMGLSHHDAEEIVQNVMLQLWKKLPEFHYDPTKGRFRGWLCVVVGNNVKMLLRRKARDCERLTAGEKEEVAGYLHGVSSSPTPEIVEEEWARYVMAMAWKTVLQEFGNNERAAFEMVSKGMAVNEISQELGIAPSSVYVYKKRVVDRLKKEVARLNRELD